MKKYHTPDLSKELPDSLWSAVPVVLKNMGIKFAPIYGAEPLMRITALEGFLDSCREFQISNSIITNSTLLNKDVIARLKSAGAESITVSYDWITTRDNSRIKKSMTGWQWLYALKDNFRDVEIIFTLNADNKHILLDVVKQMSKEGIWTSFDILHTYHGQEGSKCAVIDNTELLQETDEFSIKHLLFSLTNLKKGKQILLHNSNNYLVTFIDNYMKCIKQSWKCEAGAFITIDSDGSVFCCDDFQPESERNKFNIFEYNSKWNFSDFKQTFDPLIQKKCNGCWWSTHYMAVDWWKSQTNYVNEMTHQ